MHIMLYLYAIGCTEYVEYAKLYSFVGSTEYVEYTDTTVGCTVK